MILRVREYDNQIVPFGVCTRYLETDVLRSYISAVPGTWGRRSRKRRRRRCDAEVELALDKFGDGDEIDECNAKPKLSQESIVLPSVQLHPLISIPYTPAQ